MTDCMHFDPTRLTCNEGRELLCKILCIVVLRTEGSGILLHMHPVWSKFAGSRFDDRIDNPAEAEDCGMGNAEFGQEALEESRMPEKEDWEDTIAPQNGHCNSASAIAFSTATRPP